MPIYEYRCEKGHTFEVMQRMAEDSLTECITCGAPVQRVFHPVAVHFKGSGFYNTDYGKQKKSGSKESKESTGDSGSDSSSNSGSDKGKSSEGSGAKKSEGSSSKTPTSSSSKD